MLKLINIKYPEMKEQEEVMNEIYNFANVCENVYMEIGLQSGAILATQLLQNSTD